MNMFQLTMAMIQITQQVESLQDRLAIASRKRQFMRDLDSGFMKLCCQHLESDPKFGTTNDLAHFSEQGINDVII